MPDHARFTRSWAIIAQRHRGATCAFEPSADPVEAAISQALGEAVAQGIKSKALTPFLLARVSALTGEASLRANLALL